MSMLVKMATVLGVIHSGLPLLISVPRLFMPSFYRREGELLLHKHIL